MSIARLIDRTIEGILKDAQFAYDYIIYTDGTNVFAFNTKTKSIDFVNTDAATVINNAINALPNVSGSEYGESGTGKSGKIFIKQGIYNINSSIVIPPWSWVSIEGETKSVGQITQFGGTILDGAPGITVLSLPRGSYTYQHTKAYIAHLNIRFDTAASGNIGIDLQGTLVAEVHDVGVWGPNSAYGIGIYARAGGADHLHYYHDIDIAGFQYGFYVAQNHAIIYAMSITNCIYGLYVGGSPFHRGAIGSLQLMNNTYDLYASGANAPALFIDKLYLEHSGTPPGPVLITNSQRLIVIGSLTMVPSNATIPQMIDDINYVKVLSGRIDRWTGTPLLLKNAGTATFSGTGTQTQFTIPHGLAATPNVANVTPASANASGAFYITVDATNIYVNYTTAPPAGTNNVVLNWYAEI